AEEHKRTEQHIHEFAPAKHANQQEGDAVDTHEVRQHRKLDEVVRVEYLHADIVVQSVDDMDVPVELIAINQQFEPFGVLRCVELNTPYRQGDDGKQGHTTNNEYGPVQRFHGSLHGYAFLSPV